MLTINELTEIMNIPDAGDALAIHYLLLFVYGELLKRAAICLTNEEGAENTRRILSFNLLNYFYYGP
ncbi:hypothetical protein [Gimesia algae]|uniref:Uncharacterized protein n=1 Tax=Gimesia algae TaxID=2527971 RepID=A0A517VJM3_9PLAN|nr:hypothetical protein [Gimesia algae]QDT93186.1 hypothetical protein Pan161_48620 [Gimesia algae]